MNRSARVLLFFGIALAYAGQLVLLNTVRFSPTEGLMQALAVILLVTGAVLFGSQARETLVALPRLEFPPGDSIESRSTKLSRWMIGWLATALALSLGACFLFAANGENQIVKALWLASLGALVIAPLRGIHPRMPNIAPEERVYLTLLAVLLVITLITRTYNLAELPYNVDGDFSDVGLQARALANSQEGRLFAYGWAAVPMLGYLPEWLAMKLFGDGIVGLNMTGVMEGLLLVAGVYFVGRDLSNPRLGLLAAAVLTVSYAHLAASRQSSYIDPALFMLLAIYFLLIGLRQDKNWAIILSGILTALCFELYYSGRLVLLLDACLFGYLFFFRRPWLRARWRSLPVWVLAILVTLGPMLIVFASSPQDFITRAQFVFIFSNADAVNHLEGAYQVNSLGAVILEQARRTALLFHYYADTGTQFWMQRPFLDPLLAPLFTLGVGYALFHLNRLGDALLLAWLLLGIVLGSFVTLDPPFWTRLMVLLPPVALLTARALDIIYEQVSPALVPLGRNSQIVTSGAFGLLFIIVGILNWNTYVETKGTFATEVTRIGRYLLAQPPSTRGYLVSEKFPYDVRQLKFVAPDRLVAGLKATEAEGIITPVGSPTLLILTDEQKPLLEKLSARYPNGLAETHIGNLPNEVAFYVFRLP